MAKDDNLINLRVVVAIFLSMTLLVTLCIATPASANEERGTVCFLSSSVQGDYDANGIIGFIYMPYDELTEYQYVQYYDERNQPEKKINVFIPEGTQAYVFDNKTVNEDGVEYMSVAFPCMEDLRIYVPKYCIRSFEECFDAYDPPVIKAFSREAVFSGLQRQDHSVASVVNPGDLAVVIAAFENDLLVQVNGVYGFVRQEALVNTLNGFMCSESGRRVYDHKLKYYELAFIPSSYSAECIISAEEAKRIASDMMQSLWFNMINIPIQFSDISVEVRLNESHASGELGKTWQVLFYGRRNVNDPREQQYYLAMADPENTVILLPERGALSAKSIGDMEIEDWDIARDLYGLDIEDRYVYFIVEVSTLTGTAVIVQSFVDTPVGRIAVL